MILLAALMAVSRLWEVGSLSRVVRMGNDDMIMHQRMNCRGSCCLVFVECDLSSISRKLLAASWVGGGRPAVAGGCGR